MSEKLIPSRDSVAQKASGLMVGVVNILLWPSASGPFNRTLAVPMRTPLGAMVSLPASKLMLFRTQRQMLCEP